jgi:hypothetical protein
MLEDASIDAVASKEMHGYFLGMKYSGIDQFVTNRRNIKVVKAEHSHHYNILEQEDLLVDEITRFD